ncbi:DnaJ family domain-containing protein [Nakamurella lactea]|jgi:hypothetical protein|uniref:DnaJ family domain-containing protein n=1 Tax=Nakamurella lactea TaxID=459515 RepID=UPI00041DD712|nr:DnaJ family domain-containing protein [Nakamurella lactea]
MAGYESPIDQAIREAAERGAFDNLPGAGKPLPPTGSGGGDFLGRWAQAEEGGGSFLPMSLQLRKEAADIGTRVAKERSEQKVRSLVEDLNKRVLDEIRMPTSTPPLAMRQLDVEQIVADWQAERQRRADEQAAAIAALRPGSPEPKRRWWQIRRGAATE